MVILKLDEVTEAAFKRLRASNDAELEHVVKWMERQLAQLDEQNRVQLDGVHLRMNQGAATALATVVAFFRGTAKKGVLADTRGSGRQEQSDTARRAP